MSYVGLRRSWDAVRVARCAGALEPQRALCAIGHRGLTLAPMSVVFVMDLQRKAIMQHTLPTLTVTSNGTTYTVQGYDEQWKLALTLPTPVHLSGPGLRGAR
jgi:hypothetical protein